MGCGTSRLGYEGHEQRQPPSGIRPLLRRHLPNMRRHGQRVHHADALKHSTTGLSTQKLLPDDHCFDSTSSSDEETCPRRCSNDHDDSGAPLAAIDCPQSPERSRLLEAVSHDDVTNINTKGLPQGSMEPQHSCNNVSRGNTNREGEKVDVVVEAEAMLVAVQVKEEHVIEVIDDGRAGVSDLLADGLGDEYMYPGSPSFRMYCITPIPLSDEDENCDEVRDEIEVDVSQGGHADKPSETEHRGEGSNSRAEKRKVVIDGKNLRQLSKAMGKKGPVAMSVRQLLSLKVKSCYHPADQTRLLAAS